MTYSVFRNGSSDATNQNMFLGAEVNVARYDQFRHPIFDKLTEKQHSFFWRPEEVDVSKDRIDFTTKMTEHEQFIFVSNLQYQILLDSVQGRAPSAAFGTIASIPEMETWIERGTSQRLFIVVLIPIYYATFSLILARHLTGLQKLKKLRNVLSMYPNTTTR